MVQSAVNMSELRQPIHNDDHYQGALDALYTLVEYGDYESSRCLYALHVVKETPTGIRDRFTVRVQTFSRCWSRVIRPNGG